MARFEFKLPDIGEGVTEGEIVAWHVQEGDHVQEDQLMVEVMTDKATVTIGAPRSGRIYAVQAEVGAVVQVGQILVVLEGGNGSIAPGRQTTANQASAVGDIQDSLPGASYFSRSTTEATAHGSSTARPATATGAGLGGEVKTATTRSEKSTIQAGPGPIAIGHGGNVVPLPAAPFKALATPAVRRMARERNIDLRQVPSSGPDGRVTRDDLLAFIQHMDEAEQQPQTPAPFIPVQPLPSQGGDGEQRTPFVGMRRKIAERMRASKDTAAHFTFVEECDATELQALRKRLQPEAEAHGIKLSFLPIVIKAVVAALRKHPKLNSYLDSEHGDIVTPDGCHIGIAAATDQGLLVPVIHHAERLSMLTLAKEIERLSTAAREGKLTRQDLSGSTFTITSLGKLGGLFAVPIINYPNSAILGIHRIKERPVVRDGQIVVGHVMMLSLSMDHRLIDGHEGAAFAYDVLHYLEDPTRLMLES